MGEKTSTSRLANNDHEKESPRTGKAPICVRIYKPSKTAMQSGEAKTHRWHLIFEPVQDACLDPVMGWIGRGDTMHQLNLSFGTKEQAIAYAKSKGWAYTVIPAHAPKFQIKSYAQNFDPARKRV